MVQKIVGAILYVFSLFSPVLAFSQVYPYGDLTNITPSGGQSGDPAYTKCLNDRLALIQQQICPGSAMICVMHETQRAIADCTKPTSQAAKDGQADVANPCGTPGASCSDVPTPPVRPANLGSVPSKPAATKPAQAAAQSAQNTTPQAPPAAQSDAGGDVNMCMSAFSTAQNCCNNPTACMNSSEQAQYAQYQSAMNPQPQSAQGSSLSGTCSAMQSAGQASKNANSLMAGVCNSKQSTCTSVCGQLVAKYQALLNNCSGCSSEGIYQSTVSSLMQ